MNFKYIIPIFSLFLLGCGGSSYSKPSAQDGKGNIDLVEYMPSKNMKKSFTFVHFGRIFFGSEGNQNIVVNNNTVAIKQVAHSTGRFNTGDVVQNFKITYNNTEVTNFFIESYVDDMTNSTNYRYFDLNELINKSSSKNSYKIDYDSQIKDIGTSTDNTTYECFYKSIVHGIKDRDGKLLKADGEYLVVECNKEIKTTFSIKDEYKNLDTRDNKYYIDKTKYLEYYQKNIGYVYCETTEYIHKKLCSVGEKCDNFDTTNGSIYHVKKVELN